MDLYTAAQIANFFHLERACSGIVIPPWGSVRTGPHGHENKTGGDHTSSRTLPHPSPTNQLIVHNHCPQEPISKWQYYWLLVSSILCIQIIGNHAFSVLWIGYLRVSVNHYILYSAIEIYKMRNMECKFCLW